MKSFNKMKEAQMSRANGGSFNAAATVLCIFGATATTAVTITSTVAKASQDK